MQSKYTNKSVEIGKMLGAMISHPEKFCKDRI
jgi:hypothetical protein